VPMPVNVAKQRHKREKDGNLKCYVYKSKVRKVTLIYIAPGREGTQAWITQFYLQITPFLSLPRKRSPDGATTDL